MNSRIQKLRDGILVKKYPICIRRAQLHTASFRETEGQPQVIREAKAFASALDNITIFIEDGELIVGNTASQPRGIEINFMGELWSRETLDLLNRREIYSVSPEVEEGAEELNNYWRGKNYTSRLQNLFDDRVWPVLESGTIMPRRERNNESQYIGTKSGSGMGTGITQLINPDFEKVINEGLFKIKEEAENELKNTRVKNFESLQKAYFLQAVIISNDAAIRFANRFSVLAKEMSLKEPDIKRRRELETISDICSRVPAYPARNFYEGMQSLWFIFNLLSPCGTMAIGRMDQYLYPLYKQDVASGRMTDEGILELLQCFRIKMSEMMTISSINSRTGNTGNMVWLNAVIGGQTPDGKDGTNDLSYLILEAAIRCRTPHHTITVRVHEGTPERLMLKALETVRAGIGMPAFVGDNSYIKFFTRYGVPLQTARDYVLLGCLDGGLPHKSRIRSFGFIVTPEVLELTLNNGSHPKTGVQVGIKTGDVEQFTSFEQLMEAYKQQLSYCLGINAEVNGLDLLITREIDPNAFLSSLMDGRIQKGKELNEETLYFDQEEVMSPLGFVNTGNSLAVIKKLVFDDKKITMKELKSALAANWEGYEELRQMCLAVSKYGNGDDYVDLIVKDLYEYWGKETVKYDNSLGGKQKPSAISVVGHWQAGIVTGPLPDGRHDAEVLADGAMSPMRGTDTHGPTAVIRSAGKIDQSLYQGTLMNMKFHPSAVRTEEDLKKLASMIKTYLVDLGGEHIQFNIVSKNTLLAAQKDPDSYRDLIVRVAGFSAYYVQLDKGIQDEIINRCEHLGTG